MSLILRLIVNLIFKYIDQLKCYSLRIIPIKAPPEKLIIKLRKLLIIPRDPVLVCCVFFFWWSRFKPKR